MRKLGRETPLERLYGMTGGGHEGRIQRLEKAPILHPRSIYLKVEEHFTGSYASDTDRAADFSSSAVDTNDDVGIFGWDFATHPNTVKIVGGGPGVFIFRPYWWIIGTTGGAYPWWMGIGEGAGFPGVLPNDPQNASKTFVADFGEAWVVHDCRLAVVTAFPTSIEINTNFKDSAGRTVTEFYAGFTIARLHDI